MKVDIGDQVKPWEVGVVILLAIIGVAWVMDAWSRNIDSVFEIIGKLIAASIVVGVVAAGVGIYYLVS
jgi:hypothetical protein